MLKKFSYAVLFIISLPLVIALFVPKSYEVEREVLINRSTPEVFSYLKYLKNQDEFSKWANMDPNMTKTFYGTDGEVGFISAWESQNPDVGSGEQEIMAIKDGERIDYELRFLKPFEATEPAFIAVEAVSGEQTKVTWGFQGHFDYPMNLTLLLMDFEQVIGDDLQTGLDNLKAILEGTT